MRLTPPCLRLLFTFAFGPVTLAATPTASVAIVRAADGAPGETTREGASEFVILLRAAQLQRANHAAGLVAVGDRNGFLHAGGERALRRVALTGVVVARLARDGTVAWTPDHLFIDAGNLPAERAHRILVRGLELYGAAPVAADPERPSERELAAIRAHLEKFQALFAREGGAQVALR